jgi:hypothetical protein
MLKQCCHFVTYVDKRFIRDYFTSVGVKVSLDLLWNKSSILPSGLKEWNSTLDCRWGKHYLIFCLILFCYLPIYEKFIFNFSSFVIDKIVDKPPLCLLL